MDIKVLEILTNLNPGHNSTDGESILSKIMQNADSILSEDIRVKVKNKNANSCLIQEYLYTILFIMQELKERDLGTEENMLSVSQYQTIKKAIGFSTSIGISFCLMPGIGMQNSASSQSVFSEITQENLSIMQKYQRLSDTCRILSDCFYNLCLRPVLLPYLGLLFTGLLQLSFAPLKKPESDSVTIVSETNIEFKMSEELYSKLKADQVEFHAKLLKLIEECPQSVVIKEFMILQGTKKSPKWLRECVKAFLIDTIVQPHGVMSLIQAICEDTCESADWQKLDVVAKLISFSHGSNSEEYYTSICSQILEILTTRNLKYGATIANSCMAILYEVNPEICRRKLFHKIADPLLIKANNLELILKTEQEVSNCVETLSKCFLSSEAEFKTLPTKCLLEIALPLFYLHVKAYKSVYCHRTKIRQLLLKVLEIEASRETIFSAFLEQEVLDFGNKLSFEFGPTGGFQIIGKKVESNHEELADCLFDLVQCDETLACCLFNHLLKLLSKISTSTSLEERHLLENEFDIIDRMGKQLAILKLISNLASTKIVQETQIKNPRPLLSFIINFCKDSKLRTKEETSEDSFDILYTSLMLVKIILTDRGKPQDWQPFDEFSRFLENEKKLGSPSKHIVTIMNEIINIIKLRSTSQRFYDLSLDPNKESDFDKALKDLAEPLLPVRAHGIISLTKLIDSKNPETIAKRDVLIYLFQENLKHEDSFIYLAAINGVCALAMLFPQKVIEILVQEFIDMPQRAGAGEITAETRAKLGEILMKTTRALGEMAPKYKSLLVNAFLCGIRDSDPLVRSSSLSCLGELCKVLGFKVGNLITEILYCIGCIIKTDKDYQCRRAGVLVATLLLRGLGKDILTSLGSDLVILYRGLVHLRDTDEDSVLRLHAQLALEEFDDVVQNVLFAKPKLQKNIFLLGD